VIERIDRAVHKIAYLTALLGGLVLSALMLMTTISIIGRELGAMGHRLLRTESGFLHSLGEAINSVGFAPLPGDFELVSVGMAFCIFAFLPWCQIRRGHVTVDIFLSKVGTRTNYLIDVIANALMTAAIAVVSWGIYAGMLDKMAYNETSFILQFPIWWAFAACLVGSIIFTLICLYTVWRSLREYRSGRHVVLSGGR